MSRQPPNTTDLDDWETDPDFVREMDEMDQRWGGNKRTVGSINMNELIEDVRREHRNLREKFRDASRLNDFPSRGEFVRNVSPTSANSKKLLNEEESSSKLSTKEIKREVIRSETSSYIKESNGSRLTSETVRSNSGSPQMRSFTTTTTTSTPTSPPTATAAAAASVRRSPIPPIAPKPALSDVAARLSRGRVAEAPTEPMKRYETDTIITTDPPQQFKGGLVSKSIFRQEKSPAPQSSRGPSSGGHPTPPPAPAQAFSKSIQDRIEAFKKEFDDIEHNVARKSDISKVIKKTTTTTTSGNNDKKLDDVSYITRSNDKLNSARSPPMRQSPDGAARSTSAASFAGDDSKPRANIKSLSERFETLGRESSDDFKRRMEERRREFFDRIKTQVRETRKGLDGFDIDDSDEDAERVGAPAGGGMRQFVTKLHSPTSQLYGSQASRLSGDSLGSQRPKVYSRRETTKEEVVSRLVKENDKVVHDETKRNVERSSSCHGSSDDDEDEDGREEPSSIKFLDRELRSSPQQRTQSPSIDEIKRKVPVVEEPVVGAGLMARTLYDYQASEEDELCFDVDDLITNIEKVDQGWYRGAITKQGVKRVGLFPANYVKILNDTSEY